MIDVSVGTSGTSKNEERQVVSLQESGTSNSVEIIRLYANNEMYIHGLEENYKKLVDMSEVAEAIAATVQAYINLDKLNAESWLDIIDLYSPFIDVYLKYDIVQGFIAQSGGIAGWVK